MDDRRFGLVWTGLDAPRMEYADVRFGAEGMVATGCQIGVDPEPYAVRYRLWTDPTHVARSFVASSRTRSWERRVSLVRSDGSWQLRRESPGAGPDETEHADPGPFAGALDVDLGNSPLFNSTPVLRDGLLVEGAEPRDYLMAWVSVPDLTVTASRQRYEPFGRHGELAMIRYTSLDSGFTAPIAFDADGFVVDYEGFLRRIRIERHPAPAEFPR
jgi:hypothetical protein